MAANEVIDLDSDTSDDDYEDPPRKPIGWNYQGSIIKATQEMTPSKTNGAVEDGSDIEIVEVSPASGRPVNRIPSYSRNEIRKLVNKVSQSDISRFCKKIDVGQKVKTEPKQTKMSLKPGNLKIQKGQDEAELEKVQNEPKLKNEPAVSRLKKEPEVSRVKREPEVARLKKEPEVARLKKEPEASKEKKTLGDNRLDSKVLRTVPSGLTSGESVTECDSRDRKLEDSKDVKRNNGDLVKNVEKKDIKENEPGSSKICTDTHSKTEDSEIKAEDSEISIAAVERLMGRWEEIKSSSDDQKIRDKLWKYYYLSHSTYTHSRTFINLVEDSTSKLSKDNLYLVVKELMDCLKCYKDQPYKSRWEMEQMEKEETPGSGTPSPLPEETEEDKKRNRKLRKIDKHMKKISEKIKELEEQEIDLNDEDNSSYLLEDRLKRQFNKLHSYYCKIAECKPITGRPIEKKFRYSGSRYEEVNKRISSWVNKTKEFPDYVDILNLVKKVVNESSLPLRPETVRVQAQEIFRDVHRLLKDRRESDDLYSIYSYSNNVEQDPADNDEGLSNKLNENASLAKDKLEKVFQDFVEKEAESRENADKIAKNREDKKGKDCEAGKSTNVATDSKSETHTDKEDESDKLKTGKVNDVAESNVMEEEEEEEEVEMTQYDVVDDDDEDDDEDDDDDEEEEEEEEEDKVQDVQIVDDASCKEEEDLEDSDDEELRDVIASASVKDDLSEEEEEEDVPVIDSEEMKSDTPSSIVCIEENNSDSAAIQSDKPTQKNGESIMKEEKCSSLTDSNLKKRPFEEEFSQQKRQCLEVLNP